MKNIIKAIAIFVLIAMVAIEAKSIQESMQSQFENIEHNVAEFNQFQADQIVPLLLRARRSPQVPSPPIPMPEGGPPAGVPGAPL